jgi:uncharacterized lipoprotein YddW (UPF0748 family)
VLFLILPAMLFAANFIYLPAAITPPEPLREFRGAWITEVATNQDWPSKPGLTVKEQKVELIALLDRAVQLHLNAIILQVRPECDAVYSSPIEPWSEYLTGAMGRAPVPFYDPLAFAIAEAHKRGLELHAWFNPFCGRSPNRPSRRITFPKRILNSSAPTAAISGSTPAIRSCASMFCAWSWMS